MSIYEPPQKKKGFWNGVFGLLDKLQIKDSVTRNFIFRPPERSYTFEAKNIDKHNASFTFKPKKITAPLECPETKIHAFKLYREKGNKLYTIPVLWIQYKKNESGHKMVFSHGNSCDLGTIYGTVVALAKIIKMDIIVYDYTGYGISSHRPSEKDVYKDIECVIAFMVGEFNQPLNKIILCGYSLGSGPTVEIATKCRSIPFIVLFAPFRSCLSMVSSNPNDQFSRHNMFDNLVKMERVWCDMLIIHGDEDSVIKSEHSGDLMDAYLQTHSPMRNKAWRMEFGGAHHNDLIEVMQSEDSDFRSSFLKCFNEFVNENHTNNVFLKNASLLVEGEKSKSASPSIEGTREEFNMEIQEVDVDEEKTVSEERIGNDEKNTEENSGEGYEEVDQVKEEEALFQPITPEEILKLEMKILNNLYNQMSVNDVPERWKIKEDERKQYSLMYRKSMFY